MKRMTRVVIAACCVLALAGCSDIAPPVAPPPPPPLKIGSGVYTETVIIASMVKLLTEEKLGYPAELVLNIPSSAVMQQARQNGEIDIAIAFTGTELTGSLAPAPPQADRAAALAYLKQEFAQRFQQTVFEPLGFEDTYALAVPEETARRNNWTKISQLRTAAATMRLGTDTTWLERGADGYPSFSEHYALRFAETLPMENNLLYNALHEEKIDAALVYSTDSRIKSFHLKTLLDDQRFFPPYDAVLIARNDALTRYPGLLETVGALSGRIDNAAMVDLNYQVDELKQPPERVAQTYLRKLGLLTR